MRSDTRLLQMQVWGLSLVLKRVQQRKEAKGLLTDINRQTAAAEVTQKAQQSTLEHMTSSLQGIFLVRKK